MRIIVHRQPVETNWMWGAHGWDSPPDFTYCLLDSQVTPIGGLASQFNLGPSSRQDSQS
jgi:hypothetical protein